MSCIHIHKETDPEWRYEYCPWNGVQEIETPLIELKSLEHVDDARLKWDTRFSSTGPKTQSLQRRNGRIRRKRKKRNAKKKIRRKRVKSKMVSSLLFILLSYHHLLTICYHSFLFTAICTLRVMNCQCAKEAPLIRPRSEAGIDGERTMIRQQRHRCILCFFFPARLRESYRRIWPIERENSIPESQEDSSKRVKAPIFLKKAPRKQVTQKALISVKHEEVRACVRVRVRVWRRN